MPPMSRWTRRSGIEATWILLDYGDVVVHLFQPETRDFYGLERLWNQAPVIPVEVHEA